MKSIHASGKHAATTCLASALALACASQASAQEIGDPVPNSFICVFEADIGNVAANAQAAAQGAGGRLTRLYSHVLQGFALSTSPQAVERMVQRNPKVSYCEQDRYVGIPGADASSQSYSLAPGGKGGGGGPGGGGGGGGGGKQPPAQTVPWGVELVGGPRNGAGSTAWIIDTGIDLDHPDLNVDGLRSVSFLDGDSSPDDSNGHGTHVAGIIAAKNNTFGVVGVAADATVVSVRVLNRRGIGPDSGVLAGFDHVAQYASPGDVVNLSLVLDAPSQVLDDAVTNLGATGVYVVSGAGNNLTDAGGVSPARAEGTNVFTVAAIADDQGTWAFYSNYGSVVDFAEPGSDIPSLDKNGGYTTKSGTSQAAPHLAGILLANGGSVTTNGLTTTDTSIGLTYPVGIAP